MKYLTFHWPKNISYEKETGFWEDEMKRKLLWLCAALMLMVVGCKVDVVEYQNGKGEELVRYTFELLKTNNITALTSFIADDFQSIHTDGPRNKAEELALAKELEMGEFTLTNFTETHNKNTIIVTYFVQAKEVIDGEVLNKNPAPRLSVFQYAENRWKWIAHANLEVL